MTLKISLRNLIGAAGYSMVRHSDVLDSLKLISQLHPVRTQADLIRVGGNSDGAYLIPDDLEGIVALFSPGVSNVVEFERDFAARGIQCFLADASVEGPPISDGKFHFLKKYLGIEDTELFLTLDNWVNDFAPPEGDLVLQMDIEGAEWGVLANVSRTVLNRFRIIVIEFHNVQRVFYDALYRSVLNKLLRSHVVVHIHPNNVGAPYRMAGIDVPPVLEITFLRRDHAEILGFQCEFPHALDITNLHNTKALHLPRGWYRKDGLQ